MLNTLKQPVMPMPMQTFFDNPLFSDCQLAILSPPKDDPTPKELFRSSEDLSYLSNSHSPTLSLKRKRDDTDYYTRTNNNPPLLEDVTSPPMQATCVDDDGIAPSTIINSHRNVLAASSEFFYTMFMSGMRESYEKEV